ncbi:TasA family protein [Thermovenabulum sp.]|uniref:TasA family protein n=1 Tax=Thermovenabulum sp. TaxID=3100335 RepID=UPI003C7DB6F7
MRRNIIISLILIALLAFGIGAGTFAWFTSQAVSQNNTFTSGTLKLNENGLSDFADLGNIGNMAPGDTTKEVSLVIENDGTLNLAWFGKFNVSPAVENGTTKLAEAIYIKYAKMEFLRADGSTWETTDEFIKDGVGAGLYGSYYNNLIDPTLGVITLKNFLNDNAMGAGPGVQMGALKPGNKYKFTFVLGLAPLAGNEYQGDAEGINPINISYEVNATQLDSGALAALDAQHDEYQSLTNHLSWLNQQIDKQ